MRLIRHLAPLLVALSLLDGGLRVGRQPLPVFIGQIIAVRSEYTTDSVAPQPFGKAIQGAAHGVAAFLSRGDNTKIKIARAQEKTTLLKPS